MSLIVIMGPPKPLPPSWHQTLLQTAEKLTADGHHEMAIVAALAAVEMVAENAFTQLYRRRVPADLQEPLDAFIPLGSRLNNGRVRDLYMTLSEDRITAAPFWEGYTKAATLRNTVIHQGARANPGQAREAIDTATQMTKHILATLQKPVPTRALRMATAMLGGLAA